MGFLPLSVTLRNSSSINLVPQMALAKETPILSLFSFSKSSSESSRAIFAPAKANWTYLSILSISSSFRPKALGSKSSTQAAIWELNWETSKRVILWIAFFPFTKASQKFSFPMPLGDKTPRPVMTALLTSSLSSLS